MKSLRYLSLILTISLFSIAVASGQNLNSQGTDFWFSFMPNGVKQMPGYDYVELFVASSTNNTVTVTTSSSSRKYTARANTVLDIAVSDAEGTTAHPEIPSMNVIHVTSNDPITIYGYSVWTCNACIGGSADAFLATPTFAYGTKYYIVSYPSSAFAGYPSSGEFVVVAPYDNTTVTIHTTADTRNDTGGVGHLAGSSWTVSLQKGQSYLVQSSDSLIGENDLTGSLVTSTKPVSIVSGHEITPVPVDQNSGQTLIEMLPPVDRWGTKYFSFPFSVGVGDYYRLLSGEDGNMISINGQSPVRLNAGEFLSVDFDTTPSSFVSTNGKKLLAVKYRYSEDYHGDSRLGDPYMTLLTPEEQYQRYASLRTPTPLKSGSYINYMSFFARDSSIGRITLDGKSLDSFTYAGSALIPSEGGHIAVHRIQIGESKWSYKAESPDPFTVLQFGETGYEGYGTLGSSGQMILPRTDSRTPYISADKSSPTSYYFLAHDSHKLKDGSRYPDVGLAYIGMIIDKEDPRWDTIAQNVGFIPDPSFIPGDTVTQFRIDIVDTTLPSYAAIYMVDLVGNDTVVVLRYTPRPRIYKDTLAPIIRSSLKNKVYVLNISDSRRKSEGSWYDDSGIDSVMLEQPVNLVLHPTTPFQSGDSIYTGTLEQIDSTKPSIGTIRAVDTVGNASSETFIINASPLRSVSLFSDTKPSIRAGSMDDVNRNVAVSLPFDGIVRIEVYDEAGGLRGLLFDGRLTSGSHLIGLSAMDLNSGTYFLRMTAGNEKESYTATCPVTIIK